jgi:hypothetical protein
MQTLYRWYALWQGRRRGAQVIVFDGGAEVERTRSFVTGAAVGVGLSFVTLSLAAPGTVDPDLLRESQRRAELVREAEARVAQANELTRSCLITAQGMDATLAAYREALGKHR